MAELPKRGHRLRLDGDLVTVETATAGEEGVDLIVRGPNGVLMDRTMSWEQLAVAGVVENDGHGDPSKALAGLWGRWMQYASPRLRSAALATRPLKQFAHQDEAVFDHMLPQPRLRFLLADEPGTGKTIMTGMYLVEARRRGLIPGPSIIVAPAHLIQKWQDELEDFFGVRSSRLTPRSPVIRKISTPASTYGSRAWICSPIILMCAARPSVCGHHGRSQCSTRLTNSLRRHGIWLRRKS